MSTDPGAAPESLLATDSTAEGFALDDLRRSAAEPEVDADNGNDDSLAAPYEDDFCATDEWLRKPKHVFVLSMAGKPIYSRHGNEDRLAWLFGVMQTLVSFVQASNEDDSIRSIHAGDTTFAFLVRKPLILVAVSRTREAVPQLVAQLHYVFNQIASTLTLTRLVKIYEHRQNYDLRRQLAGAERLIDHLLDFTEHEPSFMLGAVQCLPLAASVRDTVSATIKSACAKISNVVFAILLADNRLVTMVRMRKYSLHPSDLHLVFNLVKASESLKNSENWTPLCLPRFDSAGFLYGHVSYLAEDCQACLLLLTVEQDVFYALSQAKQVIVEKLRRTACLEAINASLRESKKMADATLPNLRRFLYKCKSTAQFYDGRTVEVGEDTAVLLRAHQRVHAIARPLKLAFERRESEAVLAWDTKGFELYVVFEPLVDTGEAIGLVNKLLNWIKKREDSLFHLSAPTF